MKIIIPILENEGENSKVSEHFGHAPFFAVYETETKKLTIFENKLEHSNPDLTPVDQLMIHSPDMVCVIEIGQRAINLFKERGVNIKTGKFNSVKDFIQNLSELKDAEKGCDH